MAALGLYGCSGGGSQGGDKAQESGGGSVVEREYIPQLKGEIYLKTTETDYDFYAGVSVSDNQGNTYKPDITSNNVEFGKTGAYEIKYTFEEVVFTQKIYILSTPTITVEEGTPAIWNYVDVQKSLFEGVKAEDSLGNAITIGLLNGGEGSIYKKGIVLVGQHTVEYCAVDKAGNYAVIRRMVTVEANALAPAIADDLCMDVADEKLCMYSVKKAPVTQYPVQGTER